MRKTSRTSSKNIVLAGDIGGTHTRLGVFSMGNRRPELGAFKVYSSREAAGLENILERFLETTKASISGACFGIAGPVVRGRSQTTNLAWEVSEAHLKKRFNWPQVRLINDLGATAHALAVLTAEEMDTLNAGQPLAGSPVGIIAPGTGLGMALRVSDRNRFTVLPSEGGHIDYAPTRAIEVQLWQHLHRSMGHVSVERVLSGPGLVNLYLWLRESCRMNEPRWLADKIKIGDPAKVISETALEKRAPICVKALELFVSIFGAVAGNLALIGLTRGGIYLGGGIALQILPKLKDGLFVKSFINKGRFQELLQQIPVYVILNENAPLLGAAVCALEDQGHTFPILP
jgi:glucokinase